MIAKLKSSQILLWGHVIAFLIVLLMSLSFGVSDGAKLCVGFIVAYAIPALLSKWLMKSWSHSFAWVLLIVALIMSFGITQNLITYTQDNYTFELPFLKNDFNRDYYAALELQKGNNVGSVNLGYPLAISYIFRIINCHNIIPLLIINMCFVLSTICMTSKTCAVLLSNNIIKEEKLVFYGAILTACVSSLLLQGTILLKDAGICFAFSCIVYCYALLYRFKFGFKEIFYLLIGFLILLILKSSMAWFILVGTIILSIQTNRKQIPNYVILGIICALVIVGGSYFRSYSDIDLIQGDSKTAISESMLMLTDTKKYGQIIPGYYNSYIYRIILLPFTSAVQYLMPIPWHMFNHLDLGQFHWYGHLSFGWYFVGGSIIGFYVLQWFRKSGRGLNRWALWWILCYMGVAYYSAGTVARYYLPFIPLGVPIALHFIYSIKNGLIAMKTAKLYWIIYITLLVIALAVSYWFLEIR